MYDVRTCPWLINPCFWAILFTASRSPFSIWTAHELVKWISSSLSSFVVANPNQARKKTTTEVCISMYKTLGIDFYPGLIGIKFRSFSILTQCGQPRFDSFRGLT